MDSTTPDSSARNRPRASALIRALQLLAPLLVLPLVLAVPARSDDNQPPTASFTVSPSAPVAGEQVTFTSTSSDPDGQIVSQVWDLDDDGSFDDGSGATASRTFASAGTYKVRLRVVDNDDDSRTKVVNVVVTANRAPVAAFEADPSSPETGQTVTLSSTSSDPDGRPLTQKWDLDNDASYDDATGATATVSFRDSGTHRVALLVTDSGGAVSTTSRDLTVRQAAFPAPVVNGPKAPKLVPRLLNPFPRVRVRGVATRKGARLDLLSVITPGGTRIVVRCKGRGCPWARKTRRARFGAARVRAVRMPGFKRRHLRAGAVIRVFVTRRGRIGKYTRFKIRRLKAPLRFDSCTALGVARVRRCPR